MPDQNKAPEQMKPGQEQMKPDQGQMKPDQEQMDMFIVNGMDIIHDEKVSSGILDRILKSQEPIKAIADVTVDIVFRLSDSADQGGAKLSTGTLVHGADFLMGEIINLAETAGMQKLTKEQRTQSYQLAVSTYLDKAVKSGKMSQEELQQLGAEASQTPEGQKIMQSTGQPQGTGQQVAPEQQPQPQQPGILAGGA